MKFDLSFWSTIRLGFFYLGMINLISPGAASSEVVYKTIDEDGDGNPGWTEVAGSGGGLGQYSYIRGNPALIDETLEIPDVSTDPTFQNSFSKGPIITIADGFSVTVGQGVTWSIF